MSMATTLPLRLNLGHTKKRNLASPMASSSSPTLLTPSTKPNALPPPLLKPKCITNTNTNTASQQHHKIPRRQLLLVVAAPIAATIISSPARADSDEEYVKETEEVINKVRSTITLDRNDPNVPDAVADLRAASNSWVAKYRREKSLLGRTSFRDIYSALNAVSGHYISFGPTAPIPSKRKVRILEEMDTAEKALLRGR